MTTSLNDSLERTNRDRTPGWFVASDLPKDRSGAPRTRRNILIAVFLVAVIGISFWILHGRHSGGDPGGSLLRSLQSQVKAVLPLDAKVVSLHSADATWGSNGCDGTSGWTDPNVVMRFASAQSQSTVVEAAKHALTNAGWTYQPKLTMQQMGTLIWTKTPTETAIIELTNSQLGHLPPGEWLVYGALPPIGQAFQGC